MTKATKAVKLACQNCSSVIFLKKMVGEDEVYLLEYRDKVCDTLTTECKSNGCVYYACKKCKLAITEEEIIKMKAKTREG